LPIIRTFRQASGVSLSSRSGRNERSEWRTVRRTVDWRGAQPLIACCTKLTAADVTLADPALSGGPAVKKNSRWRYQAAIGSRATL
jgi:hypothetical protein